jgi:3',5'-cyclic AMP phosphodiesterase CpdA
MARIAHLTDIHVRDLASLRPFDLASKRLLGLANLQLRRGAEHSVEVLENAVARVVAERPDLCVVSGDLSNLGLPSEFAAARRVLSRIADAGIRIAVCPGNHDYYVSSRDPAPFERAFAPWLPEGTPGGPTSYPYVVRLDDCAVVMVSSAIVTPILCAFGEIDAPTLARIETILAQLAAERVPTMVAVHHHLGRAPNKRLDALRNMRGSAAFGAACVRHGVRLVVHGHNHVLFPWRLADREGPVVLGLSSSSSTREDFSHLARVGLYELGTRGLGVRVAERDLADGVFRADQTIDLATLAVGEA